MPEVRKGMLIVATSYSTYLPPMSPSGRDRWIEHEAGWGCDLGSDLLSDLEQVPCALSSWVLSTCSSASLTIRASVSGLPVGERGGGRGMGLAPISEWALRSTCLP